MVQNIQHILHQKGNLNTSFERTSCSCSKIQTKKKKTKQNKTKRMMIQLVDFYFVIWCL